MGHARYVLALTMMSFVMALMLSLSAIALDYYILKHNSLRNLDIDIKSAMDDLLKGNVFSSIVNEISRIYNSEPFNIRR